MMEKSGENFGKMSRSDRAEISELVLGGLPPEESLDLLEKIEQDPEASRELEMQVEILNFMSEEGGTLTVPQPEEASILARFRSWASGQWHWMPRRLRLVVLAAAAVALIFGAAEFTRRARSGSAYSNLIAFNGPELEVTLRGSPPLDIELASRLYAGGEVEEAIKVLERYIHAHPEGDDIDYAEYLLGAMNLWAAKETRFLVFVRYDLQKVRTGIEHLDASIRLASSERLMQECHWVRGMALLMIEEVGGAVHEFQAVGDSAGPRRGSALAMMEKLRAHQARRL
jgi:hypothetical protein